MAIGRKVSPAKFIGMAIMGGIAVARMIKARKAKKRALAEQKKAQAEMEKRKKEFEAQDTSNIYADVRNPYENISTENVYEDLTVNQQQAQFQAQQFQQSQANIMANLQGAAGGSGVAALAQSLANQGQIAAQQASASIGQQEAANQRLMAQGEQDVLRREQLKLKGAQDAEMLRLGGIEQQRAAEKEKAMAMMGLATGGLTSANQAVAAARAQQQQATSSLIGVAAGGLTGAAGGVGGEAGGEGGSGFMQSIGQGIGGKIGTAFGKTKFGSYLSGLAQQGGYTGTTGFGAGMAAGAEYRQLINAPAVPQ